MAGNPQEMRDKIKKEVKSLGLILLLVFTFRSSFFEPFRIPSGSMIPTLMIGDFILVNKMSYGFKLPFSDWFTDPIYLFGEKEPARGDVIVFKYPKDTSVDYIKRIVGLPGDTVQVMDNVVYVNDQPVQIQEITNDPRPPKLVEQFDSKFKNYEFRFYRVKSGEHEHWIQLRADGMAGIPYFERVTVPPGHYFAMGDDRDFSGDSRVWGFVPRPLIKGKALFVWFSMILPFNGDYDFKFRPGRIGTKIE